MEAIWRGLHYLVKESSPGQRVIIKLFNAAKEDLIGSFEQPGVFQDDDDKRAFLDNSEFCKKVYDDVFSSTYGLPFGMLIGAYEFNHSGQDIALLEKIALIADRIKAPFISAASPSMFDSERPEGQTFSKVFKQVPDLAGDFENPAYSGWQAFRNLEESQYIGLCLPHILLRDPHILSGPFNFRESEKDLLWGNAAFAFGACMTRLFNEQSWLGEIDAGAKIAEGLSFQLLQYSNEPDYVSSLDTNINKETAYQLSDIGFIPLIQTRAMDNPTFLGISAVRKPRKYDTPGANKMALESLKLENILSCSRIVHYFMVIYRDNIFADKYYFDRAYLQRLLNKWGAQYYCEIDTVDKALMAQYPLRECRVDVSEIPGQPGKYKGVAYLTPTCKASVFPVGMRMAFEMPVSRH